MVELAAPRATYRLQFSRDFRFRDAAAIAPYLARLGISHVYASPYLRARPGSTHGYDIVAHDQLNPELGDWDDYRHMCAAFAQNGLAQIIDFVPNHMGVGGADNPLWLEVLEWGPDARCAGWFDIDWEPSARYLSEKLLVPVLGDQYGAALEDGKLVLKFDAPAGEFAVWAYDTHKLPICPLHYGRILGQDHTELERLGDAFGALPEWRPQVERRARELKEELALLFAADGDAATSLQRSLARLNGAGETSREQLDALIQAQYWRASHFRVAGDDINYRRFFNVNELAGLRIELPQVFEHVHRLAIQLLREGFVDGLRIDHIDGLLDPRQYLERLRSLSLDPAGASRSFYLVVEKILAHGESVPREWPVEGTTGYEFANDLLRVLTDGRGESGLTRDYQEHSGERAPFAEVVRDAKILIMKNEMASELNVLARDAARVARQNSRTADFTRHILARALRATVACFPVYRTYLDARGELSKTDRGYIEAALLSARELERDVDPSVFDFLALLLTGDLVAAPRSGFSRAAALRCAMKFQQYSGPVMAKGLEDTAFYRFNRLISHNEVGGDPQRLTASIEEFHARNIARAKASPRSMLSTSTHDTKRGEDGRLRVAALAEIPQQWSAQVDEWRRMLAEQGNALGDANLEYFFYQTLIASVPSDGEITDDYRARTQAAMLKAAREGRARTSWARPDARFESNLAALVDTALSLPEFQRSLKAFTQIIVTAGARNSLVQTVLKLTVPGVPDIYQGSELWELSMVDPDNRRAVNYVQRSQWLDSTLEEWSRDPAGTLRRLAAKWQDGRIKLLLTALLLRFRGQHATLFSEGEYSACVVQGHANSVGAFRRVQTDVELLVVFARWPLARQRDPAWRGAKVQIEHEGVWRNVLTGEAYEIGSSLNTSVLSDDLPVAVLTRSRPNR